MATAQDTLWSKFIQPIFGFLIDREALKELSDSIDWSEAGDRLKDPGLVYPEYYSSQNFHGIKGGYPLVTS
ncbi:MAG: hypothetical protein HC764_21505 [Pleurocapsa sp. CRU_1_2]|nr:hypothetical protein [Pleurocapsa sp. CRU_1_2]